MSQSKLDAAIDRHAAAVERRFAAERDLKIARQAEADAKDAVRVIARSQAWDAEAPSSTITWDPERDPSILDESVDTLEMSVRSANMLQNANITMIGQLAQCSEEKLRQMRNCGKGTVRELDRLLRERGLSLNMVLPSDRFLVLNAEPE